MGPLTDAFRSPDEKQRYVRALFATIADHYDLITVLLSFGRDRQWKKRLVRDAGLVPGERVLDLACGTGDIALEARDRGAHVTGLDITPRMVDVARHKAAARTPAVPAATPSFVVGDMAALPFADACADVVTTGYGLRNVAVLADAVDEIHRVLRPGGRLLSLDFNRPQPRWLRRLYLGYLSVVGSALGWFLHRDPDTYRYIPESIRRYPGAQGVADLLARHGFVDVKAHAILGGLMTLHTAVRAPVKFDRRPVDTPVGTAPMCRSV